MAKRQRSLVTSTELWSEDHAFSFVQDNYYIKDIIGKKSTESMKETVLFQERSRLRVLIKPYFVTNVARNTFQPIFKKSRYTSIKSEYPDDDPEVEMVLSPYNSTIYLDAVETETEDGQIVQQLRVVVMGHGLNDLVDKCEDKKILKLKLHITIPENDSANGTKKELKITSKEMVASETTNQKYLEEPLLMKYIFEDPNLFISTLPYLVRVDTRYEWNFMVELIVDEEIAFGLVEPSTCNLMNKDMLEKQILSDFSLVAGNDDKIPCNKVFLANSSPVFHRMLQHDMKETRENEYKLEKMSVAGVKALLKYIYYASVKDALINPAIALELLEAGHKYDISLLESKMKRIFIEKPEEWFTLNVAMYLFLWSLKIDDYDEIKMKAAMVLKLFWNEVKESSLFQELFYPDPKSFTDLVSCFNGIQNM